MFGHLLITVVQQRLISTRTNDPGLKIVGNRDPRDSPKEGVSMAVSGDPGRQLFIFEGFRVGLVARTQHGHKEVARRNAAVLGIVDLHRLARPVHEHLLAGNIDLAQHRVQSARPALIQLAEAAVAVTLRLSLAVFLPQQQQRHGLSPEFFMDGRPVGQIRTPGHSRHRLNDQQLEQLLFILSRG